MTINVLERDAKLTRMVDKGAVLVLKQETDRKFK